MIVLGIDPGYALLGYGVIEVNGANMRPIDYGVIETTPDMTFPERLDKLYLGTKQLISIYKPEHVAFEELFFARNTKTALYVGAGRGVILLAAQKAQLPLYEYTPMQIKLAVSGNGHADKKQVQQMVKLIMKLKEVPKPDDAADGLAAAICHAQTMGAAAEEYRVK